MHPDTFHSLPDLKAPLCFLNCISLFSFLLLTIFYFHFSFSFLLSPPKSNSFLLLFHFLSFSTWLLILFLSSLIYSTSLSFFYILFSFTFFYSFILWQLCPVFLSPHTHFLILFLSFFKPYSFHLSFHTPPLCSSPLLSLSFWLVCFLLTVTLSNLLIHFLPPLVIFFLSFFLNFLLLLSFLYSL